MPRPFWLIEGKLAEADFFLDHLQSAQSLDEARYFFSAFATAARSITFAMHACLADAPGFEAWYGSKVESLRQNALARFFIKVRNELQKIGFNPLGSRAAGILATYYSFAGDEAPERDVVTAARTYMSLLVEIVRECYSQFLPAVGLHEAYSFADLTREGKALEDIEHGLGLPRGWTAGGRTAEARFDLLKRISDSQIHRLCSKYHQ